MLGLPLGWLVRGEPELAGGSAEGERRREREWVRFRARGAQLEGGEACGVVGRSNAGLEWLVRASKISPAMAEWREEEEGGEAARRRGSGGTYRPESTWARGVASGEGWFGPGRLDGERAERAGGELHGGAAWQLGSASGARLLLGRCQGAGQVALEGFPGSIWPRTRHGVRRAAGGGRNRATGRREMEVRAFL